MEALKATGKVKSIGVSNFTIEQLERLLYVAKIPPAVNQVHVNHDCLPDQIRFGFAMFTQCRNYNN